MIPDIQSAFEKATRISKSKVIA